MVSDPEVAIATPGVFTDAHPVVPRHGLLRALAFTVGIATNIWVSLGPFAMDRTLALALAKPLLQWPCPVQSQMLEVRESVKLIFSALSKGADEFMTIGEAYSHMLPTTEFR